MEKKQPKTERVELKYCEWCGGLWFRRTGESTAMCCACVRRQALGPVFGGAGRRSA